jgi:hypothetical protein
MNRLGNFRRNRRDYSVDQRAAGKRCVDRMDEDLYNGKFESFINLGAALSSIERSKLKRQRYELQANGTPFVQTPIMKRGSTKLFILAGLCNDVVNTIRNPLLVNVAPILRKHMDFNSIPENMYETYFGFTKAEMLDLAINLKIPEYFYLGNFDNDEV